MDTLIHIDQIISKKILPHNPMQGVIMAEFISDYKPEFYRDDWYAHSFGSIKRDSIRIEHAGNHFFHLFRKYVTPTVEEYFSWIRDLHKHLVCFEKLIDIKSNGLQDFKEFADCLNNMGNVLQKKDFNFERDALGFVEDVAQHPNPDGAFNFIMSLCPTDSRKITHMDLSDMNYQPCIDLLKLYVNCTTDVMTKLRQQQEAGRLEYDLFTDFTKSHQYNVCFNKTGNPLQAINQVKANSYLRFPEIHFFSHSFPFADQFTHLSSSQPGSEGSLYDQLKGPVNPDVAHPLHMLLFYSYALPRELDDLIQRAISVRDDKGWETALDYIKHFETTQYLVPQIQDGPIETFNVNAALSLLAGYTQMEMEFTAQDLRQIKVEPVESPVKIKRETLVSQDKKPDNTVFTVIGLLALGAVMLQTGR